MAGAPPIDLRSDTITHPTDAMRRAMAEAEVGDDVWGDDPTVNRLQEMAARKVGTEAALFCPSGTMVNNIAMWVHTGRRGAMVAHEDSHVVWYEGGSVAVLANALLRTVSGERGVYGPADVEPLLTPIDPHFAEIRLMSIENTHMRRGGTCWTSSETRRLVDWGNARGIPTHIDGARIFNSAVAQDVDVRSLTKGVGSVGFCLSKGLSAPVGSLLCGPREFIEKAKHVRKTLGGGMRQAGVIAAAGIVALETMVDRLADDHDNARRLARGLSKVPGLEVDLATVQTNVVMVGMGSLGVTADAFCAELAKEGVLAAARDVGPVVRFVTQRHVTAKHVDAAIDACARVAGRLAPRLRAKASR